MCNFEAKNPFEVLSIIKENSDTPANALFFSTLHSVIENKISPALLYVYSTNGKKIAFIQQGEERALNCTIGTKEDGEAIAEFIFEQLGKKFIYGINAPEELAAGFSRKILTLTKAKELSKRTLLLYSTSHLIPPINLDFELCKYQENRTDIAVNFMLRFWHETRSKEEMEKMGQEKAISAIKKMLSEGHSYFLTYKEMFISFGSKNGTTAAFEWVGPIYTPKEFRGRGYASALTYFLSEQIIADKKTAVLFTDESNPTSNSIYQKIGYQFQRRFLRIIFAHN